MTIKYKTYLFLFLIACILAFLVRKFWWNLIFDFKIVAIFADFALNEIGWCVMTFINTLALFWTILYVVIFVFLTDFWFFRCVNIHQSLSSCLQLYWASSCLIEIFVYKFEMPKVLKNQAFLMFWEFQFFQ